MNNYKILNIILNSLFTQDIIYHISKYFSRNYFKNNKKKIKKITCQTKNSFNYKKKYSTFHYYYH